MPDSGKIVAVKDVEEIETNRALARHFAAIAEIYKKKLKKAERAVAHNGITN